MSKDFNENVKEEVIVLSNLKNLDYKSFYNIYSPWEMEYNKKEEYPNKSKQEIQEEVKEEIKKNIEKSVKETKENFYLINNEKGKEFEQKFRQVKLKVNFNSVPKILREGKFYTISQGYFTMYGNRFFNKLYEIELKDNITSVIELDNKDLVFLAADLLIIFRLKEGNYFLFQKIEEKQTGYYTQISLKGCFADKKIYKAEFIKEISGNRFICVSNYGFKMYSLNEKNEYSISLLEWYHEGLRTIIELDKNSFIFCTQIDCGDSLGGPAHNILIIDKINLREIKQDEKENKLFKEADASRYYHHDYIRRDGRDKFTIEKDIKVINSLKFTYDYEQFIKYSSYGGHHYFRGNAILKNKYLIIGIDNNILIFDIFSGMQLKRYRLFINGENNLYIYNAIIKKWNNKEDNEFLLTIKGNIILFELTNDNNLKIISQSYIENINYLKKLNEKNNSFYDDGKKEDYNYGRRYYFYSKDENDNKNCCVSIFY